MIDLQSLKKVHLVGIRGSGMSALAKALTSRGIEVTGSDIQISGHKAENVPEDIDCLIYTVAADNSNPEILRARESQIKTLSYPEFLGELSKNMYTIAVSGTHGKTTTANMIGKILKDAGLRPLVIVGASLQNEDYGVDESGEKYLVIEACEYRRSFLHIYPDIIVITNIDNDHLDYYKDMADIELAFKEFTSNLKEGGVVITDFQNPEYQKMLQLKIPGAHNVKNALNALAATLKVGVPLPVVIKSLNSFSGAERRFEFKGKSKKGSLVFDDYAHHPTEVEATLSASKEKYPDLKLVVVFQPHLYSRTKEHLEKFADKLNIANEVILLPIYAAREKLDLSIKSEDIANKINTVSGDAKVMSMEEAIKHCSQIGNSIIITMGAGDVYKVSEAII